MGQLKRLTALLVFFSLTAASANAARVGEKAPEFELQDLDGRAVSLKDYRGKVVFVDFWASWCGPCKQELPAINRFLKEQRGADIVCLAINIDKKKSHAQDFLSGVAGREKNLVVLYDGDSLVVSRYRVAAMPTSLMIDREGNVRYIHYGYNESDPAKWAQELNSLLK